VKLTDGTFAIIHINRLKKVHGQVVENKASPVGKQVYKAVRRRKPKETVQKEQGEAEETEGWDTKVPYHPHVAENESVVSSNSETDEENLPLDRGNNSEWNPGSSYLKRKLRDENTTADVAYQLRSRLVSRSVQEAETDKARTEVNESPGNTDAQEQLSASKNKNHSFNLRSRIMSPLPE
jgi:hypothetical protein